MNRPPVLLSWAMFDVWEKETQSWDYSWDYQATIFRHTKRQNLHSINRNRVPVRTLLLMYWECYFIMAFAGSITSKSYCFMGFSWLQALLKSLIVVIVQTFKVYYYYYTAQCYAMVPCHSDIGNLLFNLLLSQVTDLSYTITVPIVLSMSWSILTIKWYSQ